MNNPTPENLKGLPPVLECFYRYPDLPFEIIVEAQILGLFREAKKSTATKSRDKRKLAELLDRYLSTVRYLTVQPAPEKFLCMTVRNIRRVKFATGLLH